MANYAGGYSSSFVPPSLVPSSSCSPSDLESLHPDPAEIVDPFQEQLLPPHPLPSSELLELALSSEKLSELVLLSQVGESTCIIIIELYRTNVQWQELGNGMVGVSERKVGTYPSRSVNEVLTLKSIRHLAYLALNPYNKSYFAR